MTTREKIAHLYRRFGFGASQDEINVGEQIGLDAAMHRLLDYHTVDEQFPVHPYEFCWRQKGEADPGAYNHRSWWAMRMVCTNRPAQEHLTLFWHGHFAVGDDKVENGPMMLQYLDTLRTHADGKFVDLLKAISKDPAMMRYLDLQRSLVGNPNENFAREVMELFTLGIGNYTETDVKEAAKAFTGWSYVDMFYEFPGPNEKRLKEGMANRRPFSAFCWMPAMHDSTPKKILGKTDFFDGDSFLEHLASQRQCARFMCKKLWSFYAYSNPDPELVEQLADEWQRSGGDIKHMLFTIARHPEFWSDKCVGNKVKSPADLCVGVARQMGAGPQLLALRGPSNEFLPIKDQVKNNLYGIVDRMEKAGLSLFYPPNVAGWKGGVAWISPAAMVERYRYRGIFLYGNHGAGVGALNALEFVKSKNPTDTTGIAKGIAELFDVPLNDEGIKILATIADRRGGMKLLTDPNGWAGNLDRSMMVLMAAPEMQMC